MDNTFHIDAPTSVKVTFVCPASQQSVTVEAKDLMYIYDKGTGWQQDNEILLDVSPCPACGFSHEIKM